MSVRRLGWAGLELEAAGETILIDPLADPTAVFAPLGPPPAAIYRRWSGRSGTPTGWRSAKGPSTSSSPDQRSCGAVSAPSAAESKASVPWIPRTRRWPESCFRRRPSIDPLRQVCHRALVPATCGRTCLGARLRRVPRRRPQPSDPTADTPPRRVGTVDRGLGHGAPWREGPAAAARQARSEVIRSSRSASAGRDRPDLPRGPSDG